MKIVFIYDVKGNIAERCEYVYTSKTGEEPYELTCVYDNMGNPAIYRGKAAAWKGRQLTLFNGNTFNYDGRGRRTSKNGIAYIYDSCGRVIKQSNGLEFYYDFEGIAACRYNDQLYLYITDGQGNVIALIDTNGNEVVQYRYDAWGNHAVVDGNGNEITGATHIGNLNPFRYRGYYYDIETGLYFLQTRYYDPEVGRFLNRDSVNYADPQTINGLNLYTYCGNDPVMGYDPEGTWNWLKALAVVVVAALVVVAIVATAGAAAIPATTTGAALATTALDLTAAAAGGAAFSGVLSISSQSDEEFSIKQFGIDLAVGAVSGMFSYGTGKVLGYMGESFGIALSNSSFMSFPIKNVFSGEFMGKAGQFLGGFTGGLFGGMFIDKYVAKLCGMPSSLLERLGSNIGGDVFSRIISLFGGILR